MKRTSEILAENREWIESTFARLDKKLRKMAVRSRDIIAYTTDENGRHIGKSGSGIHWWCNGFWGGLNALMYEYTGEQVYLDCAKSIEKQMDTALYEKYDLLHHDVGFQWHLLSGELYRITGDKASRTRNLFAASLLASRFNLSGRFIRAWNGAHQANWTIIDTMMNLPLLYWASEEIGDDRFKQIAMAHADMALRDHLRPDGSVAHICEHDHKTGALIRTLPGQGYAVGSAWSRGCSWAVYGYIQSYHATKEKRYLDASKLAANYFISETSDDRLPKIDFRAPKTPVYYDTTAGMIAAAGLIELSKALSDGEGAVYMDSAINLIRAITEKFVNFDEENDTVVAYGSERYPIDGDERKAGVHIPIIYGDYYFVDSLIKLLRA